MPGPEPLYELLAGRGMARFADALAQKNRDYFSTTQHGDLKRWQQALGRLPQLQPTEIQLNSAAIRIGTAADIDDTGRLLLARQLRALMPWRKGPFDWFGLRLDAEWQANLKWDRCAAAMTPLAGRIVLDVGCGNGYYGFRMLGAGADVVVGIDPSLLFVMQFHAANNYIGNTRIHVFPLRLAQLKFASLLFDSVFSMGVLYHQRDPLLHLRQLYQALAPGGELVLESLVLEGEMDLLEPKKRYAKMNNVWYIPSCRLLLQRVKESGFIGAEIVSSMTTTTAEQRCTEWMRFESLADFLSPTDPTKTIEGYPAPRRAILIAKRPKSG